MTLSMISVCLILKNEKKFFHFSTLNIFGHIHGKNFQHISKFYFYV